MATATGAFSARPSLVLRFIVNESSTNAATYETTVNWNLAITAAGNTSTSFNNNNNSNWSIDVNTNGSTAPSSGTYSYDFRAPNTTTTKTIASGSKVISRGGPGSYTTNFTGGADGGTGPIGSASASGSLALTNIVAPPFFPFFPPSFPFFPFFPPSFPFFPFFPFFPPSFPYFPPTATVPNVAGQALATAQSNIEAAGFVYSLGSSPAGTTVYTNVGKASSYSPTGTQNVGSTITVQGYTYTEPGSRFDGASVVKHTLAKRFDGAAWVDITTRKRFDGTNWVDIE